MASKVILPAIFFLFSCLTNAQDITNIFFEQEGKKINIYYDLKGLDTYEIKVYCGQDGISYWGNQLSQVTGAVGKGQNEGTGKKIIWDVLAEREKLEGDIKFKIEALSGNQTGIFTDNRDGKKYNWVKIGEQIWMAENLNYATSFGSWCYDNNTSNCEVYGRLYDWNTANTACPSSWHLPSDQEWTVLIDHLGGSDVAGGKMKNTGTAHWKSPNKSASNLSGFSALPAGGYYTDRRFYDLGQYGLFWSTREYNWSYARNRYLSSDNAGAPEHYYPKSGGFSVRCIKD